MAPEAQTNPEKKGLFSSFVSLFSKGKPEGNAFQPQGVGGAQVVGKWLTITEKNPNLATLDRRVKKYQEIAFNTSIVATGLRYISALISSTNWNLHPPQEADPDKKQPGNLTKAEAKKAKLYADTIEMNMSRMDQPWYKVVRTAAQYKWIGFSVQERVARRMDEIEPGYIGIGTVENRPQHTFEQWDLEPRTCHVLGWVQRDPNTADTVELDRDRCIYIVDDILTSQPDGVGLLRHVVELCDQLKRLEQIEIWAYETDLRGVPIGFAPTATLDSMVQRNQLTPEQRTAKLQGIQDFITNHVVNPELGLLLDSSVYTTQDAARTPSGAKMWGMELAKGSGSGLAEIHEAIQRKQHEIGRAIGVEQFMLGAGGKGSLALSEDKARALVEFINAIIMEVAWCLERDYIRPIFELNRWDLKLMPRLLPDAVALRSVSVIVDALSKLALAGATIDRNDPVINQIRAMLKLVDQPFVTPEMMMADKPANVGGEPGKKGPNKSPPLTDSKKAMKDLLHEILAAFEEAA